MVMSLISGLHILTVAWIHNLNSHLNLIQSPKNVIVRDNNRANLRQHKSQTISFGQEPSTTRKFPFSQQYVYIWKTGSPPKPLYTLLTWRHICGRGWAGFWVQGRQGWRRWLLGRPAVSWPVWVAGCNATPPLEDRNYSVHRYACV